MASNELILFGGLYALLLIVLAWAAEQSERWPHRARGILYGMSLGVYCSSWTFLGAVGNAAASGWTFLPIYLGPILLFLFAWPFIQRLLWPEAATGSPPSRISLAHAMARTRNWRPP